MPAAGYDSGRAGDPVLDVPPGVAPACLTEWVKSEKGWDDFARAGDACRRSVRSALVAAQGGRCAYCQRVISGEGDSHIEHFRPRWKQPNLRFVWGNLLASCNGADHCGKAKGGSESELVDPRRHRPSRIFTLEPNTGRIALRSDVCAGCAKRGAASLKVLKLNCPGLVSHRRRAAKDLLAVLRTEGFRVPDCLGDEDFVPLIEEFLLDYPFLPLLLDTWRVPKPSGPECAGCSA